MSVYLDYKPRLLQMAKGVDMCEISTALLWLAAGGIVGAIASLGVAIALNNAFCTAPAAPGAMIAAGVASLVAVTALSLLGSEISNYYECMNAPQACAVDLTNAINAVNALKTVLGFQASACFVAAGIAWIPWAGAVPMYVILASLIIQLAVIPSLIIFLINLVSCANDATAAPTVTVLTGAALAVAAATIGLTAYVRRDLPWRWEAPRK